MGICTTNYGSLKMFLFYHSKQTEENKSFYKGLLFESLLKKYLQASGFNVELRKKKNSLEYDIEGVNVTTQQQVIGEAKALEKSITGKEFSAFVGKLLPLGLNEKKVHGLFLSTAPLTPEADDYYSKVKSYGITSITGKGLFRSIEDSLRCPSFDVLASVLQQQGYIPVTSKILKTDDDIFLVLIARAHNSITPAYFSVFDLNCNQIDDVQFLQALTSSEIPLQPLEPILSPKKPSKIYREKERSIPKGLSLGTDWADYKLPASPNVFIGRDKFIERLSTYIDENQGPNILQVKSRSGVGKSSVLAFIEKAKVEAGAITELHDARDIKSTLDIFSVVQRFTNSDYLAQDFRDIENQINNLIENNRDRLKLFFVDQFESTFLVPEIFEAYENLFDIFSRSKNKTFVIFARKNDQLTTFDNSKISLEKINQSSKSFELPDFSVEEAISLIRRINETAAKPITREVQSYVLSFAQGFPWLLKRTMAHLTRLVSKGVIQSELISAGLQLDDLFNEELEELDEMERDYLSRIARLLPADFNQIHRHFDEDPLLLKILDKLTASRLIRLTGITYDTYSDVFKDYLVYQKLPEFRQINVYRTSPSPVLAVFHSLIDKNKKDISVEDIEKTQGLSRGYAFNILRELRNFNLIIASKDGWEVSQSVRDIYNHGRLGEYIRRQLLKNEIVSRIINAVSHGDKFSVKAMSKYLQQQFPFIEASSKTWESYSLVFRAWLTETKLLVETDDGNLIQPTESRSSIIETLGNLGMLNVRRRASSRLDFFLPSSPNVALVENAWQSIQGGVPVSQIDDRVAISDLRLGGWLTGDQPVTVSPGEFRKLLKEALTTEPLQIIWETVRQDEPVRPPFEKIMDDRYTEETLKWRLKTLLRWGKDLTIIPQGRVRHQHYAKSFGTASKRGKGSAVKKGDYVPKIKISGSLFSSSEPNKVIDYSEIKDFIKKTFPRTIGITRIDIFTKRGTHGWEIRVRRRDKNYNEFFSDSIYGGIKDAFEAAKEQLAEINKLITPYKRRENAIRITARNKSGIVGVRRGKSVTKRNGKVWTTDAWFASGSPMPGKEKLRRFSVKRWGEEGAKEKAIAQRKQWEREMDFYEQEQSGNKPEA